MPASSASSLKERTETKPKRRRTPQTARPRLSDLKPKQCEITLHGHRVAYRTAGDGPVLLLVHGITGNARQWDEVIPLLAQHYHVIAPDLLGHGESAKPRGDYSLGAYAAGIRDLLITLGHKRATVVGHSLGGGIAMQFSYESPPFAERLVLVNSGGLGREVHALLRAASLPGSEIVLPLIAHARVLGLGAAIGSELGKLRFLARPGARLRDRVGVPQPRLPRRPRPRRDGRRLRVARRRPGARRVRAHDPRRDRPVRSARERHRPPLPDPAHAVADRVGRPRPADPGRARGDRQRGHAGQQARDL